MGKNIFLFWIIVICFQINIFAQVNLEWLGIYDYIHWEDDPTDFCVDKNGDIIITGNSEGSIDPQSDYDYATVKFSKNGQLIWVTRNDWGINDYPSSIVLDDTLNSYVTGTTGYCTTLKYDSTGTVKWESTSHYFCNGKDILLDQSGNIIVFGTNENSGNFFLQKINKNGSEIWFKEFSEFDSTFCNRIIYYGNNLYLMGNYIKSYDETSGFLCAVDLNGQVLWSKTIDSDSMKSNPI